MKTRLRIAYGVMGYGRGHAMRTSAVLPALMREHDITVFAGDDAYDALAPLFPTVRIPTLGYRYDDAGAHSLTRTVSQNFSLMRELLFGGPGMDALEREFRARGIQAVISDSEAYTHRMALRLRLPRISFDHVGIIAYCKPHFPAHLLAHGLRDAAGYRMLMGLPERILISSFYRAEPGSDRVRIVGPMLRDEVRAAQPTTGEYVLAYFNKGEHQYRPALDRALRGLDCPVIVYGTPYEGVRDNLEFRAPSRDGFIRDLAGCRAVVATAGNQLIGEAMHLGKPLLALPEDAFEQQLNAHLIERMGIGARHSLRGVRSGDIEEFLSRNAAFRREMPRHVLGDGRDEAARILLEDLDALALRRNPAQRRPARLTATRAATES